MAVAKGPLKRELTLYSEERTRVGQPLAGRAALWHVYARFKLDRGMAMGIDLSTLVQLTFSGCLETFLSAWDYILMGLVKQPDDDLLLCLLDTQLRKSKALGPAFVVYDGAQEGTKERSFQFLYNAARQEILRKQREVTRDGLLKQPPKAAPAASRAESKRRPRPRSPRAGEQRLPPGLESPPAAPAVATEICEYFARTGKCRFGDKCKYKHDKSSAPGDKRTGTPPRSPRSPRRPRSTTPTRAGAKAAAKPAATDKSKQPCRFLKLGLCKHGASCPYSHSTKGE